jgi:RNA polymerase sigma-70 factor (ECF subfamily)
MMSRPDPQCETNDVNAAMDRYARGDERAFSQVYQAMAPRLYSFLLRKIGNPAQAEDLVQQTFLKVHCARSRYLTGADLAPWFFAIARRLMIDMRRRAKPSTSLSTDQGDGRALPNELVSHIGADERFYSKQLGSMLETRLRSLPKKHRVAFQLVKLDGLSHAEAADTLGTTSTAVKVRIHRICRMLLETPRRLDGGRRFPSDPVTRRPVRASLPAHNLGTLGAYPARLPRHGTGHPLCR